MNICRRVYLSALVVSRALFPPCPGGLSRDEPAVSCRQSPLQGYITVESADIPLYLADLSRAVDRQGKLALFFPGCMAAAAPFLLFRLKRSGFSDCRALVTGAGLRLTASR